MIGAGPVGLAAAAHLLERGLQPIVLEAGRMPDSSQWQHVSCSRLGIQHRQGSRAAARANRLEFAGPACLSTGAELLERYIEPLATKTALKD